MKKTILNVLAAGSVMLFACNNTNTDNQKKENDSMDMAKAGHVTSENPTAKVITPAFTNVDSKARASVNLITDHYLHIKNALSNDNSTEAANAARGIAETVAKLDKSLFTAEQKTAFDKNEDQLKSNAAAIVAGIGKIKEQRLQFADMSEAVYEIAKNFGAGHPIYHDHCPMARDNQGAMWLSEIEEIKNPYFGAAMLNCGTVEEVIK